MAELGSGIEEFIAVLDRTWAVVGAVEPARGSVRPSDVLAARDALERMVAERTARCDPTQIEPDAARHLDARMATIYGRAAAIAIAADDAALADAWLAAAERLASDDQRAELAAARRSPERYRALVHGRALLAGGEESQARKVWKRLTRGEPDAISRAAEAELDAPIPVGGAVSAPGLWTINGIGTRFFARRDARPDRSYVTTHCFAVFFVPVIPLSAWRVRDEAGGFCILARERLSRRARAVRWALPAAIALAIIIGAVIAELDDPARLARHRWDDALELAQRGDAEAALHELEGELARDVALVDGDRAERAGAEVVRLTAGYIATPFTSEQLDKAMRVVQRYQALPRVAQLGPAQAAILDQLDRWTRQLGDGASTADARLALLRAAAEVAFADRRHELEAEIAATQLALARPKQADWPLDALAILVGHPGATPAPAVIAAADEIVERLCDSPSLLVDAGPDLDAWNAASKSSSRGRALNLRNLALEARTAAEAEGVTPKQLAEMQLKRPWDQYVVVELARNDMSAGQLDAAAARLAKLGAPGATVRAARFASAQLAAAQGKLDVADATLSSLLASRLARFAAASAALQDIATAVQKRLEGQLDRDPPLDLQRKYDAASESQRSEVIAGWFDEQMRNDSTLSAARARYAAFGDVVPTALTAGSVKLRRAQELSGPARNAMLQDAERTFLAIRLEAQGQPEFRLALGEIYARLGKTKESDAEFTAVLDKHDPKLTLHVAHVYREIGSVARAKQLAKDVFEAAASPTKESAAAMLGVMCNGLEDDEAAAWFGRANASDPFVRASLLEIDGRRLAREGKDAECAAKFAEAAKIHLATANSTNLVGFNNAAVAYDQGFRCSGDPQTLRAGVTALERAYRDAPEAPIVAGNLIHALSVSGMLRVLGRHLDVRALRLDAEDVGRLTEGLQEGAEWAALLGELNADPSLRRARELLAQYEVLAPNNPAPYQLRLADAMLKRDVDGAAAVLERLRRAKALDASEAAAARKRWLSGVDDATVIAVLDTTRARLEAVLARPAVDRLDPRTRAAGLYVLGRTLADLGLQKSEAAMLPRAREAVAQAVRLWPALDGNGIATTTLIDEAGLEGNAKTWLAARRLRGALSALDQLAIDHDPLAAKIQAAKQFSDAAAHAKANVRRPTVGDLRFARLVGDPALEARMKAVLDDKLARVELEVELALEPTNQVTRQDLAYLDRR